MPGTYQLDVYRGDSETRIFTFTDEAGDPIDYSASTWTAQIRRHEKAETAVDLTVDTTDAATGVIVVELSAEDSAALPGRGVWDLQRTTGDDVETVLAGPVCVAGEVTR